MCRGVAFAPYKGFVLLSTRALRKRRLIEYATIYHSNLFNSRGASASTAVVLVWKNAVLLSK